jgi:nitroreductase
MPEINPLEVIEECVRECLRTTDRERLAHILSETLSNLQIENSEDDAFHMLSTAIGDTVNKDRKRGAHLLEVWQQVEKQRLQLPEQTPGTTDLFEMIRTTRSMRRLRPDPVPDALIRQILEAGVCAPSGGNMQRWRFLVIRDPEIKQTVGAYYKRAWDEQVGPRYRAGEPPPGTDRERFLRMLDAAEYLAAHIHEAPMWVVPCLEGGTPTRTSGSSIYPAIQNMLLAARALGLGATLTTLYLGFEKEAEAALGLPAGWHSYAILPIGYPLGRFGPVRRVALSDVVFEDRWGQPYRNL